MNVESGKSESLDNREYSISEDGRRKTVLQNNHVSLDLAVGYPIRDNLGKFTM